MDESDALLQQPWQPQTVLAAVVATRDDHRIGFLPPCADATMPVYLPRGTRGAGSSAHPHGLRRTRAGVVRKDVKT